MSSGGGTNGAGIILEYDYSTNTYTKKLICQQLMELILTDGCCRRVMVIILNPQKLNNMKKKLNFLFCASYTGTNAIKFKDITQTVTITKGNISPQLYSVSQAKITGNARQSITSVNVNAGISFDL